MNGDANDTNRKTDQEQDWPPLPAHVHPDRAAAVKERLLRSLKIMAETVEPQEQEDDIVSPRIPAE